MHPSTSMKSTTKKPCHPTSRDKPLSFRVWSHDSIDPSLWCCIAAFRYLQECIDYLAYCQDRGADVLFQSPTGVSEVKASDRRFKSFKSA